MDDALKESLLTLMCSEMLAVWLDTENPGFDNRTPSDLIFNGEAWRVEAMVHNIRTGHPI